jgi:hypothetical protein
MEIEKRLQQQIKENEKAAPVITVVKNIAPRLY